MNYLILVVIFVVGKARTADLLTDHIGVRGHDAHLGVGWQIGCRAFLEVGVQGSFKDWLLCLRLELLEILVCRDHSLTQRCTVITSCITTLGAS